MSKGGNGGPKMKYNAADETNRGRQRQRGLYFQFGKNIVPGFNYGGNTSLQPFNGPREWVRLGPFKIAKTMEAYARNMRMKKYVESTPWVDCVCIYIQS